jgi:hypothetical protein
MNVARGFVLSLAAHAAQTPACTKELGKVLLPRMRSKLGRVSPRRTSSSANAVRLRKNRAGAEESLVARILQSSSAQMMRTAAPLAVLNHRDQDACTRPKEDI